MVKTMLEVLILWLLICSPINANRSWNSTVREGSTANPQPTPVFNSTGGFQYVDPFIGTAGDMPDAGHVFPGATLPFGMVKAVADTNGRDNLGGFTVDNSLIYGFSHMHDSGTFKAVVWRFVHVVDIVNNKCRNRWGKLESPSLSYDTCRRPFPHLVSRSKLCDQ
jgi:putative alpha-1,2-mannosidase